MITALKVACIGAGGTIVAALIGAVVFFIKRDKPRVEIQQDVSDEGIGVVHTGTGDVTVEKIAEK